MSKYAAQTQVSSNRSRDEIERTLIRYGATGFMYGWQENQAIIAFQASGRHVKFAFLMPDKKSTIICKTKTGRAKSETQIEQAYEQAVRQRWRALALVIKAKLEAVEAGITCFEDEFLSHIVLPNGETVGSWMLPQLNSAYENNKMPLLLPEISS